MTTEMLNFFVGIAAIALQVVTLVLLVALLFKRKVALFAEILRPFETWGIQIALIAALIASGMALYYEMVVGYPPCWFCWWQRVCMFPQVLLFGVALSTRERTAAIYSSLTLSLIGLLFGIYNHILQVSPAGTLPCPSQGVSCAQIFYLEFGYITFPMLAITFFAFLIVLTLIVRKR